MNLNLRDLRYFEIITQEGSLALASERLSRSQPALSKCLQRLEENIGAPLFIRDGRGVHLTAVGEVLLAKVKQLSLAVEQTEKDMRSFVQGSIGQVRIGCLPSVAEYIIPSTCRKFLDNNPNVNIQLFSDVPNMLMDMLLGQQVDLIITTASKPNDNIITYPINDDPMVVIAHASHPLLDIAQQRELKVEDLLDYRWTLPNSLSVIRKWIDNYFINLGLSKPTVQIETQSFRMVPKIIEQTQLISFLPRKSLNSIEVKQKNLVEIPFAEIIYNRKLIISRLKSRAMSPAVEKMIKLLCEESSRLLL